MFWLLSASAASARLDALARRCRGHSGASTEQHKPTAICQVAAGSGCTVCRRRRATPRNSSSPAAAMLGSASSARAPSRQQRLQECFKALPDRSRSHHTLTCISRSPPPVTLACRSVTERLAHTRALEHSAVPMWWLGHPTARAAPREAAWKGLGAREREEKRERAFKSDLLPESECVEGPLRSRFSLFLAFRHSFRRFGCDEPRADSPETCRDGPDRAGAPFSSPLVPPPPFTNHRRKPQTAYGWW